MSKQRQVVIAGEDAKKWNRIVTDVLRFYIGLCRKHGLRYYIAYGSAIGAARHHGFIPWDDDVDVVMPRPDYDKLVQICATEDLGHYAFVDAYNTPNYPYPFAKLYDRRTTLLEFDEFRFELGLYIDIFVYDGMVDDKQVSDSLRAEYVKYWNRLAVVSSFYPWHKIKEKLLRGEVKDLLHYFLLSLDRKRFREKFLRRLHDIVRRYDYETHDTIVKYPPGYGDREVIPKAWIEETTELPFEDLMVTIPKDYEHFLNHYFGDYKQLPPPEQRASHHVKCYVNMDAYEPLEAVLRKVR